MKRIIVLMLILGVSSAFSIIKSYVPIEVQWSPDLKLTTEYFQSVSVLQDKRAATIETGIKLNLNYNGVFRPRAVCFMNTRTSYMINTMDKNQTNMVLNHEKRHFDVAEYITRCLNAQLMKISDHNVAIDVYNRYINKLDSMQILYDSQSEHCLDTVYQKIWDNKLDSLLKLK